MSIPRLPVRASGDRDDKREERDVARIAVTQSISLDGTPKHVSGRRLFPDRGPSIELRLVDTITTDTGVVIATYRN